MNLRIGIDATALPPRPVGAGWYIIQLIRALARQERACELVVFAQPHSAALLNLPDSLGLEVVLTPQYPASLRLMWEQLALPGLTRRYGLDILHSLHYTRPLRLPCRSVVTLHDMTFFLFPHLHTRSKRLFFPPMIRYSARTADRLITVSENTRQDAMRILHIPEERITATPLGVDAAFRVINDLSEHQRVRQKFNLPEAFILYVGLIEPRKNLPLLLRAYALLHKDGNPPPLVVVGRRGWMVEKVFRLVDELDLKNHVHFLGYVPQEDLPVVYNLAEIFVYPTLYEGFGMPTLEALACGTPLITCAVASLPEIVGDAALMIPPADETALAQALERLLADPQLRCQLSQAGVQRAAAFTWERTARGTLAVYDAVMGI